MNENEKRILETQDDLGMMNNPQLWPDVVLCLKKSKVTKPVSPLDFLFGRLRRDSTTVFPVPFGGFEEPIKYASVEAIVEDGWLVD